MASNTPFSLVSYGYNTDDSDEIVLAEDNNNETDQEVVEDTNLIKSDTPVDLSTILAEYNENDADINNVHTNDALIDTPVDSSQPDSTSNDKNGGHFSNWYTGVFNEPSNNTSESLQRRIEELHVSRKAGNSFNRSLRKSELYNRPNGLDMLLKKFSINQKSTNFAKEVYNPNRFEKQDEYDVLAEEVERYLKELAEKQANRKQIQFTRGR